MTDILAPPDEPYLRFSALGGLAEIGMNCHVLESNGKLLLIDCGVTFPEGDHYGIDLIVPDFTWLIERAEDIVALVITHGHMDHIGAVPYLLRDLDIPVYAPRFALGLIEAMLEEHELLAESELHRIEPGDELELAPFRIECIHVNHSIPDTLALAIDTPVGKVVHTGDFKIDLDPVNEAPTELSRLAALGDAGVRVLLSDSTNIERPGWTGSEAVVRDGLRRQILEAPERVVIAAFSTNIHRIQGLLDAARESGRKVLLLGRSIQKNIRIARRLGLLTVPDAGIFVELENAADVPRAELLVICTGSQGEPRAALTRLATGEYRSFQLGSGDLVIFSSRTIPGNERAISRLKDNLVRCGARVIDSRTPGIHVSGHASRDELALMLRLVQPEEFVPVHGDYRYLIEHAELAESLGVEITHVIENGDVLEFVAGDSGIVGRREARRCVVDGGMLGDIEGEAFRERRRLARRGLCLVWTVVDTESGEIVEGPEIINRGALEQDSPVLAQAQKDAIAAFEQLTDTARQERAEVAEIIRLAVMRRLREGAGRKPMVESIVHFV